MKRINFDIQHLTAFVATAELGSFRLAAEQIHLSQPALSRRIERLETSLGVRLFNRTTRDVKLTPIGRSFLDQVKATLDQLEQVALNIGEIADAYIGQICIACIPSTIDSLLINSIASILKKYPKIKMKILDGSESSVIENVKSGRADFGLSFLSSPVPGIIFEAVSKDPFIALVQANNPLAKFKKLEWEQLHGLNIITIGQESGNRQMLNQQFHSQDLNNSISIEANRASSIPNLISAGLGVGVIPSLSFSPANHPNLKAIPLSNPSLSREIGIIKIHGGKMSPVANLIIKELQSHASNSL